MPASLPEGDQPKPANPSPHHRCAIPTHQHGDAGTPSEVYLGPPVHPVHCRLRNPLPGGDSPADGDGEDHHQGAVSPLQTCRDSGRGTDGPGGPASCHLHPTPRSTPRTPADPLAKPGTA